MKADTEVHEKEKAQYLNRTQLSQMITDDFLFRDSKMKHEADLDPLDKRRQLL